MDAISDYWNTIMAYGPLTGLVIIYVVAASGGVILVAWDLKRWYRGRDLTRLRYWFQKVRELMPKGVTGTSDDHALNAVSMACYEAIFALAAEGIISWKKEEYYNELLAIAFGSETLTKRKTHRAAMRNRVEKNIASVKAGPMHPIPAPKLEPVKKLGYLSRKSAA